MNGKTTKIKFGIVKVKIFISSIKMIYSIKKYPNLIIKKTGEIKERISVDNFSMKCEETKEIFEGIFDFEKGKMISGKGIFHWKDNKNKRNWNCKGKIFFFFFFFFFFS